MLPTAPSIGANVEPEGITEEADGSVAVDVHQVVHDVNTGELISDSRVRHRYWLEDGLVARMDVLELPTGSRASGLPRSSRSGKAALSRADARQGYI